MSELSAHEKKHQRLAAIRRLLLGVEPKKCDECDRLAAERAVKDAEAEKEAAEVEARRKKMEIEAGLSRVKFAYNNQGWNGVAQTFNAYCTEAGVQCTVTSDPTDFQQLFHFKNVGDRLVKIEYEDATRWLEPGDAVTLKARGMNVRGSDADKFPKIRAYNRGATDA